MSDKKGQGLYCCPFHLQVWAVQKVRIKLDMVPSQSRDRARDRALTYFFTSVLVSAAGLRRARLATVRTHSRELASLQAHRRETRPNLHARYPIIGS